MNNNGFNAAQLQAVQHTLGPAMILAGPGSGKTTVIVHRLKYLIEEFGAAPQEILVITFTRAAAIEMQYRFMKITDSSYPEVSFGTFHSIFYQIIRSSNRYRNSNLSIATEKFKYEIIGDIITSLKSDGVINAEEKDDFFEEISEMISEISRLKNMGLDPADCSQSLRSQRVFPEIFRLYNQRMNEFSKIDFDDMIIRCFELLTKDRQLLDFWQKRYSFIMIDEYQDINLMQYKVLRLLSEGSENIFAVGDDDQSIYGFRGSDPKIMLDYPKSFAGLTPEIITLCINYRCGKTILDTSLKVISENKCRYKKELSAGKPSFLGSVIPRRFETREIQNARIADFLKKRDSENESIAILFRTNKEAVALSRVLDHYGVVTNLSEAAKSIYENSAVKLCIEYLSFAYEGCKRSSFLKIMNHPMRYISRESAYNETVKEGEILKFYNGNRQRQKVVKELFGHLNMISHLRPVLSIKYLRRHVGLDGLYPESRNILDEFEKEVSFYEDTKVLLRDIRERADKEKESAINSVKKTDNKNVIKILTMHAAKGLEFDIVWLPDLNEGIIPSRNSVSNEQTEEERRMLYVAMTRAKKALIMSYITGTKESPMLPCRFLRPIKDLWDEAYKNDQRSSEPSSGSSTSSSNSTSSR